LLEEVQGRRPQDPWVLWGLAEVGYEKARIDKNKWTRKTELEGAESSLEDLIDLRPRFAPAYWRQGEILSLLGQTQEALDAYLALLKLDPSYKKAQGLVARLLNRLGRTREA